MLTSLTRGLSFCIRNPFTDPEVAQGMVSLAAVGLSHQYQQIRNKSKIRFCGYLEPPEFKKRDLRYKTSTVHDPKRMSWGDYQVGLLIY